MSIDDQLKLLLKNLNKNSKLKKSPDYEPPQLKVPEGADLGSLPQGATSSAYNLINEVIMHPSIMWNRQFFYSLGSMMKTEQDLMQEWFLEMNDKQKIYINEIERANDQLKATAQKLFKEKGFNNDQC